MSKISRLALLALLSCAGFAAPAWADNPAVITGYYPGGASQPSPAPAAYAPAPATRPSHGRYGGGFIEFLMTGGTTGAQAVVPSYNRPQQVAALPAATAPAMGAASQNGIDPEFQRQEVAYSGSERPGTIVIDTPHKWLFLVEGNGRALRYGIGVGRPGFEWAGMKTITRKAEWPTWTPPADMLLRRPSLPRQMAGGPDNPLGARALYLGSSMYRIHGTNQPETIGKDVSSGCIRMMNEDVEDLYNRVDVGTKVLVM